MHRSAQALAIGPSSLAWEGDHLCIRIDEVTAPLPSRVRGVVRVYPGASPRHEVALDAHGRHRWWPVAPRARIEVALKNPASRWSGNAYFDANAGTEPLADAFAGWTWSRAQRNDGTAILYDVARRDGTALSLALDIDDGGRVQPFAPPGVVALPRTGWHVDRRTRADAGHGATVIRTLQDTPFYARSLVATHLLGTPVTAMHESLSLDRFRAGWVQALLPFRAVRAPR